jgi:phosphoenolpyruvate synthase/pyruvate phosphate dikinase
MRRDVLGFKDIDRTEVAIVGGKGSQLGELSRIQGIHVPAGFCVTTEAFRRIMAGASIVDQQMDRLSHLDQGDREAIRTLSAELRQTIEEIAIPEALAAEITGWLVRLNEYGAYAVRSSATAEDLPTTSFAGQHETFLNVVGTATILNRISQCWASLFTERAVTYRLRNGFDHRTVYMAVVVQQMVFPEAAGVLFTADPVTSNRKLVSVEATFGLGEALVSGLANADVYRVRNGEIVAKTIGTKRLALYGSAAGGTHELAIGSPRQEQSALTDAQVVQLAQLGRRIEECLGCPQDIEWCFVEGEFQIVQSRPITTLFPIPVTDDGENHVFVSVGHGQMMTDAIKPLGISMWQLTALPRMYEAGGRLFVDVTQRLVSPGSRASLLEVMGRSDPLFKDALESVLERDDFIPLVPDEGQGSAPTVSPPAPLETDPAIVAALVARTQESISALQLEIRTKSGSALVDFILADITELKRILFDPQSHQVFMSAMEATWWLNEHLEAWL